MKKHTLLFLLIHLILNGNLAQSPVISIPPYYLENDPLLPMGNFSLYNLPQPNPSLWNASTASIYSPYGGPVDILEWKDQAYDGRPAKSASNTIFGPDGELVAFIIDEYVFDSVKRLK